MRNQNNTETTSSESNNPSAISSQSTTTTTTTAIPPETKAMTTNLDLLNFIKENETLTKKTEQQLIKLIQTNINSKEKLINVLKSKELIEKLIQYTENFPIPLFTLCCLKHIKELKQEEWTKLIKLPHILHILCWSAYLVKKRPAEKGHLNAAISRLLENKDTTLAVIKIDEWKTIISQPWCLSVIVSSHRQKLSYAFLQALTASGSLATVTKGEWKKIFLKTPESIVNILRFIKYKELTLNVKSVEILYRALVQSGSFSLLTKEDWINLLKKANPSLLSNILNIYMKGCEKKDANLRQPLYDLAASEALASLKKDAWVDLIVKTKFGLFSMLYIFYADDKELIETFKAFMDKTKAEILKTLTTNQWKNIVKKCPSVLRFPETRTIFRDQKIFEQISKDTWLRILHRNGLSGIVKRAFRRGDDVEINVLIKSGALSSLDNKELQAMANKFSKELPRVLQLDKQFTPYLTQQLVRLEILHLVPIEILEPAYVELYEQCRHHWEPKIIKLQEKIFNQLLEKQQKHKEQKHKEQKNLQNNNSSRIDGQNNNTGLSQKETMILDNEEVRHKIKLLGEKGYLDKDDFITLYNEHNLFATNPNDYNLPCKSELWDNALKLSEKVLKTQNLSMELTITPITRRIFNHQSNEVVTLFAHTYRIDVERYERRFNTNIENTAKIYDEEGLWQSLKKYIPYALLLKKQDLKYAIRMLRSLIQMNDEFKEIEEQTLVDLCWQLIQPAWDCAKIEDFKTFLNENSVTTDTEGLSGNHSESTTDNENNDTSSMTTAASAPNNNHKRKHESTDFFPQKKAKTVNIITTRSIP